jgi:hypothetical protein
MSDANSFLFGGGGRAAKFEDVGDSVTGTVVSFEVVQQTAMETNEPLTWSDGKPRMQMVVDLQTDLRDGGDEDDGIRRIYVKGGNYEVAEGSGTSMKDALSDAVRKAGAKEFATGATLTMAFTGMGKKTNRGFAAPKLYRARYEVPKQSTNVDDLFGDDSPF